MAVETRSIQELRNLKTNWVLLSVFAVEYIRNYSATVRKEDQ